MVRYSTARLDRVVRLFNNFSNSVCIIDFLVGCITSLFIQIETVEKSPDINKECKQSGPAYQNRTPTV
jgi:hypothetical protein